MENILDHKFVGVYFSGGFTLELNCQIGSILSVFFYIEKKNIKYAFTVVFTVYYRLFYSFLAKSNCTYEAKQLMKENVKGKIKNDT